MSEYNKNNNCEEGMVTAVNNGEEIDLGCNGSEDGFDVFAEPVILQSTDAQAENGVNVEPQDGSSDTSVFAETSANPLDVSNPLDAAIAASETKQAETTREGLLSKPPVFEYANVKEEITDTSKTFEELRAEKAADFPELEEASRVSWKVTYGKTTKAVSDPKGTSIAKIKTEIEQSIEFLDGLKKTKGEIVCKVTPTVTAQKKGEMSAYCGIFTTLEDADNSGKSICFVPSDDGNVYEIRCNEVGRFITKARNTKGLSSIRAGFTPALPHIPYAVICQAVTFFRAFMAAGHETEALVNVYWDKETKDYCPHAPVQIVSKARVEAQPPDIDTERFIHVAEIHSHNTMAAKFSATDDNDEKAARIYMVIGRLNQFFPEISVRIASGGEFVDIEPSLVIEKDGWSFPDEWLKNVTVAEKRVDDV